MKENGQEHQQALTKIDHIPQTLINLDPEVSSAAAANLCALAVDWMGFNELMQNQAFVEELNRLPVAKLSDQPADYIAHIWPMLTDKERGTALDLGLQKMTTMGHISRTGIQVRIWRAFRSGEWQHSPAGENDFRPWVRSVLTDSLSFSSGESSKLATLCEVIGYLGDNFRFEFGIPENLEDCFRRPHYWRWKTVAPKILQVINAFEEETDEIEIRALEEEIGALVEAVYDEDLTSEDITSQGRKSAPRLKPIILLENRRLANVHTGIYEITDAQLSYLRKKLGTTLDYRLEGEIYDVDQWTMVQYRYRTGEICTECGAIGSLNPVTSTCTQCSSWGKMEGLELCDRRELVPSGGWTEWDNLEEGEPKNKGVFESELSDQDMGLEYLTYWVKNDS